MSVYFYQGRTVRGLRWTAMALAAQLIVTVAMGIFLLALAAALGPGIREPQLPEPYMTIAMGAGISYIVAQIAVGMVFVAGFVRLYTGGREFGQKHVDRLEMALVLFIVSAMAVYASYSLPSVGPTPEPSFVSPAPSALQGFLGPFLGGVAALLAGVTLFVAVQTFITEAQRRRMVIATALGIAGGAGRQFLMLLGAISPTSPGSVPLTVISVAIVGSAVSAASLALFRLVYRDIYGRIEAGVIAPSLPRGPWDAAPGYPVNPYRPPAPPSPPPR